MSTYDGRNFLSDKKYKINDSVIINLKEKKIEKHLPLNENSGAFVFAGKHAGEKGIIKKIDLEKKRVELNVNKKLINVLIEHLIAIK